VWLSIIFGLPENLIQTAVRVNPFRLSRVGDISPGAHGHLIHKADNDRVRQHNRATVLKQLLCGAASKTALGYGTRHVFALISPVRLAFAGSGVVGIRSD